VSANLARAETAAVDGGSLYYETCGSGPAAIVLIHDGILHSAAFDGVWPLLCAKFKVVRYDRRGYGRSAAAGAPYSPTDDLAAVMKAAGISHATLVGASAGGGLAVDYALANPAAVDRLVLVGAQVSGLAISEHFMKRSIGVAARLRQGDIAGAAKDPYILAPGHDAERARVVALVSANPQNVAHPDPARPMPPARARLGSLKVPTLILVGEADIPDMHAQAGALEALIPGSKRVVVQDAGHFMYLEHPQAFGGLVAAFVNGGAAP
jgi:pimeloyl-ACP methyl ester carboxylesterase